MTRQDKSGETEVKNETVFVLDDKGGRGVPSPHVTGLEQTTPIVPPRNSGWAEDARKGERTGAVPVYVWRKVKSSVPDESGVRVTGKDTDVRRDELTRPDAGGRCD